MSERFEEYVVHLRMLGECGGPPHPKGRQPLRSIERLAEHDVSGATIKSPLREPLPTPLIQDVVRWLFDDFGRKPGG
jgi:hypothetical protein